MAGPAIVLLTVVSPGAMVVSGGGGGTPMMDSMVPACSPTETDTTTRHYPDEEVKGHKVVVEEWITANGVVTVRGEVVVLQVPEKMVDDLVV